MDQQHRLAAWAEYFIIPITGLNCPVSPLMPLVKERRGDEEGHSPLWCLRAAACLSLTCRRNSCTAPRPSLRKTQPGGWAGGERGDEVRWPSRLMDWSIDRLIDWLSEWWIVRWMDWLIECLIGLIDRVTDWLIDWLIDVMDATMVGELLVIWRSHYFKPNFRGRSED